MKQSFFGSVQFVPGVGYVEAGAPVGALGDDASVMMISGLGNDVTVGKSALTLAAETVQAARDATADIAASQSGAAPPMMVGFLERRVSIFNIDLPMWAWILIGLGILGAGWVFFKEEMKGGKNGKA